MIDREEKMVSVVLSFNHQKSRVMLGRVTKNLLGKLHYEEDDDAMYLDVVHHLHQFLLQKFGFGLMDESGKTFEEFAEDNSKLFVDYANTFYGVANEDVQLVEEDFADLDDLEDCSEGVDSNGAYESMWSCKPNGWSDKLKSMMHDAGLPEVYVEVVKFHRIRASSYSQRVAKEGHNQAINPEVICLFVNLLI